MNPAHLEGYPDEQCAACEGDLGDDAYEVRDQIYCSSCVTPASRCDNGCGMYRCGCPEERE